MRGYLVEGVRLIFIALLATGGFLLGGTVAAESTSRALAFIFLGAGVGFVIGGVVGRLTLRAVSGLERELRRKPRRSSRGASWGSSSGWWSAGLLMIPLLFVPPRRGMAGHRVRLHGLRLARVSESGEAKYEDIFGLVGMKPRASVASRGDLHVIDTSALIDGRVADLVATGFVTGTVLLHDGVLRELQAISDSCDPRRRTRGRRGLDVLVELQKAPTIQFQLVEEVGVSDVDAALVRLARSAGRRSSRSTTTSRRSPRRSGCPSRRSTRSPRSSGCRTRPATRSRCAS